MMHVVPFQVQEEAPGKQLVSIEDFLSSAGQKDIAAAILVRLSPFLYSLLSIKLS